ncbi:MAG: hypothetical protein IKO55_12730 [Kiritimatiellae bacterium]|nr:hypothetical protein [Kiritimatiellia bacterium]
MKATSRMEGTTMMDSISKETRRRLVDEGYRLHMAIVAWGKKQGVRAYRVVPKDRSAYFEIYDPKTKKFSYEFPRKIRAAIDAHAEALAEYERWSRSLDQSPRGRVLSDKTQHNDPERDNRTIRDCNGEMRSTSPIKCDSDGVPAGDGLQAAQANGDGSQTDPASGASAKRPEVDFRT